VINLVIFASGSGQHTQLNREFEAVLERESFLPTQGLVYSRHLEGRAEQVDSRVLLLAAKVRQGVASREDRSTLGVWALRDSAFVSSIIQSEVAPEGVDQVAWIGWRKQALELKAAQDRHPNHQWGLSAFQSGPLRWLTYQFAHTGWMHLAVNLTFLLLFGGLIERILGPLWVLAAYLLGGLAGAAGYVLVTGLTTAPLVGASGAVAAMMGLVMVLYWGREIRFWYWMLPAQGYYGLVRLPAWYLLVSFVLFDAAGLAEVYFSHSPAPVAHAAHLGGWALGAAVGLLARATLDLNEMNWPAQPELRL
jgi:membrane associated rhomboid family serine protease